MSKRTFNKTAKAGWEKWASQQNIDNPNFVSFMNDPTQTEKTLEAFKKYPPVLKETGISYDFAAIKAAAFNSAMNVGIIMAVNAAAQILTTTWDYFNVTVEEQVEKLQQLNAEYEAIRSEYEQLASKDSLTDSENDRMEYLEKQLELEEKLLEAETRRLYLEQQGNTQKFTDWFDSDSDVKKRASEFGTDFAEDATAFKLFSAFFTGALPNFYDIKAAVSGYDAAVKKAETDIKKLEELKVNASKLQEKHDNQELNDFELGVYLGNNENQQEKTLNRLYNEYTTLLEKQKEYNENAYSAKERMDSGLLFGSDLKAAEDSYNTWSNASTGLNDLIQQLEEILQITNEVQETSAEGISSPFGELAEDSKISSEAILDQIRITNAEEAVMASLGMTFDNYASAKKEAADAGVDLFQAVEKEIQALSDQGLISQDTATALFYYQLQKALANENGLDTSDDCDSLIVLAQNADNAGGILQSLIELKNIYQQLSPEDLGQDEKTRLTAEAEKLTASIKSQAANFKTSTESAKQYTGQTNGLAGAQRGAASAANRHTSALEAQKSALEEQKAVLEDQKSALEDQKQHYEEVIQAVNWFYDKQISKVQNLIDALEKENKLLEKRKGNYDMALSSIDRFYEREIQQTKDRQDAIQEKIDALRAENEERQKSYDLEKAAYDLERARNQRTNQVYVQGKGMVYMADDNAIQEAENTYDNLLVDQQVTNLEKQKADLDVTIAKLEEYRQMWSEISNAYEFAQQDMMMSQLLGATWESDLLNGRMETLSLFRDTYNEIQAEINSNEQMIASYEEKIEYYQGLKDHWEELTGKYQEETYIQLLTTEFGNNYENELLNGRTGRWTKFSEDYAGIQKQLKEVTDQIETLAARMESYAARMESAADRVNRAAGSIDGVGGGNRRLLQLAPIGQGRARGGIISQKDSNSLDYLARSVGEDHLVPLQEGEAVIPKAAVRGNFALVEALLSGKPEALKREHPLGDLPSGLYPDLQKTLLRTPFSAPPAASVAVTEHTSAATLQFYGDLSFPNIHSGEDARKLVEELSRLSSRGQQYFHRQ